MKSNPYLEYDNPHFYSFSQDSILPFVEVFEREKNNLNEKSKVLDLCAGSGIVGLEFFLKQKKEQGFSVHYSFCEIQDEFIPFLKSNIKKSNLLLSEIIHENLENLLQMNYENSFDIILSNPPFFLREKNRVSKNINTAICKFFVTTTLEKYLEVLFFALKDKGRAYFLARLDQFPSVLKNDHIHIVSHFHNVSLLLFQK